MSILFDDAASQSLYRTSAVVNALPITMACWFRSDDDTIRQGLVSLYVDANNYYVLEARGDVAGDKIYALVNDTGGAVSASMGPFGANTWNHGCAVFASTTNRQVYLDGVAGALSTTLKTPNTPTNTGIGRIVTTPYVSGRIAEVAIWNVALSENEIMMLAKGIAPLRIRGQNLKGYWPLYTSDRLIDYSGNQNTMIAVNSPVTAEPPPVRTAFGFGYEWRGAISPRLYITRAGYLGDLKLGHSILGNRGLSK